MSSLDYKKEKFLRDRVHRTNLLSKMLCLRLLFLPYDMTSSRKEFLAHTSTTLIVIQIPIDCVRTGRFTHSIELLPHRPAYSNVGDSRKGNIPRVNSVRG